MLTLLDNDERELLSHVKGTGELTRRCVVNNADHKTLPTELRYTGRFRARTDTEESRVNNGTADRRKCDLS